MPDILIFSRIRSTFVEPVKKNRLRAVCQLNDTLTEATVEVSVKPPELEIVDAKAEIVRGSLKTPRKRNTTGKEGHRDKDRPWNEKDHRGPYW